MKLPYNYKQQGSTYRFDTDNGVYYSVDFTDGAVYFFDLPAYIPIFEFSIKVLHLGSNITPPKDERIEPTIVAILIHFFQENSNSLIYVCDNLDKKHHARHRKFSSWFSKQNVSYLEKFDTSFTLEDIEILASLILHHDNPFKRELIKYFFGQQKFYEKEE
jgi:Family of unknown function (DUF6169)